MKCNCIVTQTHIPSYDVQGSLNALDKKQLVELSLIHLRKYNPDAYIILTGHGLRPNYSMCDWIYWEDECRPLNKAGLVIGMPAQFEFVHIGLEHARQQNFNYVLKTRTDSIIGKPNIIPKCHQILQDEHKDLLVTQQTSPGHELGDCLLYGKMELMYLLWHKNNPVTHACGLKNSAANLMRIFDCPPNKWDWLVHEKCAFRNVTWFKFMDMRWNWQALRPYINTILDGTFDYNQYHWGKTNGWHNIVGRRDLCKTHKYDEEKFYGTA